MRRCMRIIGGAMIASAITLIAGCTNTPDMNPTVRSARVQNATITAPTGMVQDKRGNIYVSEAASGCVYCLTPDGDTIILAQNLDAPGALCLDRDNNLLVAEAGSGRILRILQDGTVVTMQGSRN